MSRRSVISHGWSLSPTDPVAHPNARIALALIRCVRRLPGVVAQHNFDDLGTVLAPALERLRRPLVGVDPPFEAPPVVVASGLKRSVPDRPTEVPQAPDVRMHGRAKLDLLRARVLHPN